ncbi:unnamed protein product, partial [Discosporangium mesarthrocarpum]
PATALGGIPGISQPPGLGLPTVPAPPGLGRELSGGQGNLVLLAGHAVSDGVSSSSAPTSSMFSNPFFSSGTGGTELTVSNAVVTATATATPPGFSSLPSTAASSGSSSPAFPKVGDTSSVPPSFFGEHFGGDSMFSGGMFSSAIVGGMFPVAGTETWAGAGATGLEGGVGAGAGITTVEASPSSPAPLTNKSFTPASPAALGVAPQTPGHATKSPRIAPLLAAAVSSSPSSPQVRAP